MDIQKHLRHLLGFFWFYSCFITSRILRQESVGWRDIIYTVCLSIGMVIILWYFQLKHERGPKTL